ncbi:MAG: nucleotidyl transferase AbiEii/AbiGii toxin family protein [Bdellovibrionales bacterium]|nr:nucleotidyl transferase AbiEii/AbiGii toxin family protein [Bdellovibrionales bacterium]
MEEYLYPIEVIFAEKFQTAASRGVANSRMKDYLDMILLLRSFEMESKKLKSAIADTFENRKTQLGELEFSEVEMETLQGRWRNFDKSISANAADKIPKDFKRIISEINKTLATLGVF